MIVYTNGYIKHKKNVFTCEVPAILIMGESYWSSLVLIELAGDITSMRAIWASLVKESSKTDTITTSVKLHGKGQELSLRLAAGTKLISTSKDNHLLVRSTEFSEKGRKYFVGGSLEEPAPHFKDVLRIHEPDLPFKVEWLPYLWKRGIEEQNIRMLNNYGTNVTGWYLEQRSNWHEIVKEIIHGKTRGS